MQVSNLREELIAEIPVSKSLIDLTSDTVGIFALDSRTIGLSNNPPEFWSEQCLWQGKTQVITDEEGYTILLPQEIISFYQAKKIDVSVDVNKTRLLLLVNTPGSQ